MGKIEELIENTTKRIKRNKLAMIGMSSPGKRDLELCDEMLEEFVEKLQQLKSSLPTAEITELQAWKKIAETTDTDELTFNPADFYHDMRILFKHADLNVPVRGDKTLYDNGYRIVHESSLPTQQDKVVVPEFVAEWIEHVKSLHWGIIDLFSPEASSHSVTPLVEEWLTKENAERLTRAWLDGYTVEKEPLYYIYDSIADQYLGYDRVTKNVWWLLKQNDGARAEVTDAEINEIGAQYRAFAVPVGEEAE